MWRSSRIPACSPPAGSPKRAARPTTKLWSGWLCWTTTPPHDEATIDPAAFKVLGDTAYGTGHARAALNASGHTAVIKPGPLRPAVAGGFTSTTSPSTKPRAPSPVRTVSPGG